MSNKDVIFVTEDTASLVMVPVKAVTADLVTETGDVIYVPLATTKNPGIVQVGKGLRVTDKGLLSVDVSDISAGITVKHKDVLLNENVKVVNFTNAFDVSIDPETLEVKIDGSETLNRIVEKYVDDYAFIVAAFDNYYDKTYIDNLIINNLETDNAAKALSAAQGVMLKDMILEIPHAKTFDTISEMVSVLNGSGVDAYRTGSTIRIVDTQVPDFWISGVVDDYVSYDYVDDDALVSYFDNNARLQIGYYQISKAEVGKIVLDDYVKKQYPEFDAGATRGYVYFIDTNHNQIVKKVQIQANQDTIPLRNPNGNFYVGAPTLPYECANVQTITALHGTSAPTTATKALYEGQFYYDTQNKKMYQCVGIDTTNKVYDWSQIIRSTDYAGNSVKGVVDVRAFFGTQTDQYGRLQIVKATDDEIIEKTNQYHPLVPSDVDLVIKTGLTTNTLTWSDDDKYKARKLLGLDNYVTTDTRQEISGLKTFVEQIGLKNTNGTIDYIKHINNNLLISTNTGSNLLNIDEGLSKIYAFNKELAFKTDIADASGTTIYVGDDDAAVYSVRFDSDPQTQLNVLQNESKKHLTYKTLVVPQIISGYENLSFDNETNIVTLNPKLVAQCDGGSLVESWRTETNDFTNLIQYQIENPKSFTKQHVFMFNPNSSLLDNGNRAGYLYVDNFLGYFDEAPNVDPDSLWWYGVYYNTKTKKSYRYSNGEWETMSLSAPLGYFDLKDNTWHDVENAPRVVTKNYLEKYVTTETAQEITGQKTFVDEYPVFKSNSIDLAAPSEWLYEYTDYIDKNNTRIGVQGAISRPDGFHGMYMQAGNVAGMGIITNGTDTYTWAPTPSVTSNDTNIATTAYTRDVLKYFNSLTGPFVTSIVDNEDLNWYKFLEPGVYVAGGNRTAGSLSHSPTNQGFTMVVRAVLDEFLRDVETDTYCYRIREITTHNNIRYTQAVYSTSVAGTFIFGSWERQLGPTSSRWTINQGLTNLTGTSTSGTFYIELGANKAVAPGYVNSYSYYNQAGGQYANNALFALTGLTIAAPKWETRSGTTAWWSAVTYYLYRGSNDGTITGNIIFDIISQS